LLLAKKSMLECNLIKRKSVFVSLLCRFASLTYMIGDCLITYLVFSAARVLSPSSHLRIDDSLTVLWLLVDCSWWS